VITLRHADISDLSVVADLLYDVERFYGTVDFPPRQQWEQQIESLLFTDAPAARVLLAIRNGEPQGFASYSFLWPAAGVSKSLYLKELYVRESQRRRGIGAHLMSRLCAIAVESGSSRLEWTTDTDNSEAQKFYGKLGVSRASAKVMYRAEGDVLVRLSRL
jgi:ribosomal protein S18 acetylase RimI-like enzyme